MIKGKKILLVPPEEKDLEKFEKWFSEEELTKYWDTSFPLNRENFREKIFKTSDKYFMIKIKNKKIIGFVEMKNIDWKNSKCMIGIMIEKKEHNRGYGTDAIKTLLNFIFSQLNLHKVYLYVFEENKKAIRVYEKCGFKVEGKLIDDVYKGGKFHNYLRMFILKEDFLKEGVKI
jgi:RimJ/RimL family protein N-acetyltransferase